MRLALLKIMSKLQQSNLSSQRVFEIREDRQFRALRSPVRQEVVDVMESMGPCTIASVAERLGRRPDTLYFHFRTLEASGLVRRVGEEGSGREKAAVYDLPGRAMRLSYVGSAAQRSKRVGPVADSVLRLARRDVKRALGREGVEVGGPAREVWVARTRGWLTKAELARVNVLLGRAAEMVRKGRERKGAKAMAVVFALTPARDRAEKTGARD